MKKSLLLGILVLGAGAASSYAQGFINLDNYNSSVNPLVTYGSGVFANGVSGALGTVGAGLNSSWTAGLYYVVGTPSITDPAGNGIPNGALALGTGAAGTATAVFSTSSFGNLGEFAASSGFNTGGVLGDTVTVEVIAYDTAAGSYANAAFRGHSAPFTIVTEAGNALPPTSLVGNQMTTFAVTAVPEPTTLALAGLGGLASLVMLRRKKA